MTLRINEIYTSVQGEGPRVGQPTVFVRFAGCNLRCPLWPCDTEHAINPKLRETEWHKVTVDNVYDAICLEAGDGDIRNICLTGGEPFLQPWSELLDLVTHLELNGFHVEAFTNSTVKYPLWAFDKVDMVMDWKLPGCGDKHIDPVRQYENISKMHKGGDAIKFTIADVADFNEAARRWWAYTNDEYIHGLKPEVYVGAVFEKVDPTDIVQWVRRANLPWKLNVQLHKYLWAPDARRT